MSGDTAPIRPEERFDEERVAAYLQEHLSQFAAGRPVAFDQFPGGAANLTYRAVSGDSELVLRRAPLGEVAQGGHDMGREYRVLSQLWKAFPKAPRAYHYCNDPSVMGKPFFVMERRHGHVVRDAWPAALSNDASRRTLVARNLVATLAELHTVDPHEVGLGDLGRPEGFVHRQVDGWARRWEAARTRELPRMDRLTAQLAALVPRPPATTLLHNDFKLDNTMISDEAAIVGVFDWDMATRGDPLVDLGTMLAYWFDDGGPGAAVFGDAVRPLTPYMSQVEVVERYSLATGFDVSELRFYVALAFYRIAIIIEQIYARYVRGQTSDARFARFAAAAPVLAETAVETLEGRGVLSGLV